MIKHPGDYGVEPQTGKRTDKDRLGLEMVLQALESGFKPKPAISPVRRLYTTTRTIDNKRFFIQCGRSALVG